MLRVGSNILFKQSLRVWILQVRIVYVSYVAMPEVTLILHPCRRVLETRDLTKQLSFPRSNSDITGNETEPITGPVHQGRARQAEPESRHGNDGRHT